MVLIFVMTCVAALFGASAYALFMRSHAMLDRTVYGACATACSLLLFAAIAACGGVSSSAMLPLGIPGVGMNMRLDALGAFFLAVVNLGGAAASIYAIGYGAHEKNPTRILPFFPLFLAAMNLVVIADDAFAFLLAWELMSLASWALILAHDLETENRQAGYIYLVMASFGTLALMLAFGVLGGGAHFTFAEMREGSRTVLTSALVLGLVVFGAGSKAGVVPLHIWLPLAHPAAPSHVSALMSGVMTKVAIYGFIRIVFDLLGPPAFWWGIGPMIFGGLTALIGILFANAQNDLKKLLAYSTIENIGVIFIALGLSLVFKANNMAVAAALALTAALFHVFNHSLFKSLLFFGAGAVLTSTHERNIEQLGGLINRMPKTAFVFLGGCIAIAALPPLNGFASEWLLFQGILLSPSLPQWLLKLIVPAVGVTLALSAALGAACYVRVYGVVFLGRPRSESVMRAVETDRFSLSAMFALLALCILAGLFPGIFIDAIAPVTDALVGGRMPVQTKVAWLSIVPVAESKSSYNGFFVSFFIIISGLVAYFGIRRFWPMPVRRAPAWDCGYVDPSPITQYSASSFGQPIRRAIGPIAYSVREHLDMPLPGETRPARFGVELEDRAWRYAYWPVTRAVVFCADRINALNYLSIQEYLALVFAALVLLLLLVAI